MRVAVVIPCYKVTNFIVDVIDRIGPEVEIIYAVDDCCPDKSGDYVEQHVTDSRVQVLRNPVNKGVGGAVITGYKQALKDGLDIAVKVDGDGQMDPALIPLFIDPLVAGEADYAKGNRFFSASAVRSMPKIRLWGNATLSFMTKFSSGYWSIFDPTNGYTAIHKRALGSLNLRTLSERYFFETDMLIRLGDLRAVVVDVPMRAVYGEEISGLSLTANLLEFLRKHIKATIRRFVYLYLMRDFNIASLNLIFGALLIIFGGIFGISEWIHSVRSGVPASAGTVMLSVLPIMSGLQMVLFFLGYDIAAEPKKPIQKQAVLASLDPIENRVSMPSSHPKKSKEQA